MKKQQKLEFIYTGKLRSFFVGASAGFIVFSCGVFMLFVPFIGILLFALAFCTALCLPFAMLLPKFRKVIRGYCPRCKNRLLALAYFKSIVCKICHNRILITEKGFELV